MKKDMSRDNSPSSSDSSTVIPTKATVNEGACRMDTAMPLKPPGPRSA